MRTQFSRLVCSLPFVLAVTVLFFIPPLVPTAANPLVPLQTFVLQPDPLRGIDTFYGTYYHQGGQPTKDELWFGGWGDYYYPFIDFNLIGSPDEYQTIDAHLELYASGIGPNDPVLQLWRVVGPWTENSISFANHPAAVPCYPCPPVHGGWNSYDITRLYRYWKSNPSGQFGIEFVSLDTSNDSRGAFVSSDSNDVAHRPRLVITYQ